MSSKTAVITGAAGDLGGALCAALSAEGWRVIGVDIRPPADVIADVCDAVRLAEIAAEVGEDLALWVNAAGVLGGGKPGVCDLDTWGRLIAVNLTGTYAGCEAAFAVMKAGGGGRIVNIGSLAGQMGGAPGMHPAYGASKAGVHALTKTYAQAGGRHGIRCNAVAPGVLAGSMADSQPVEMLAKIARGNPMGRLGRMSEVVQAVLFLGDPERSDYVNGAILPINGGLR
ncbi:MAG: 3-oxoacyl-[acyl-carrier protein] reductase [Myxococcota bacterium]|jgi:3-oxoacyl-[acyl-carrier protein] reductase